MSGGGGPDLAIDKESLEQITKGLRAAISELREIGTNTGSLIGAGFDQLSLTSMETGHNELAKDFEDFVELWEWGVRGLVQDANVLARKVGLAAGAHFEEEQYIKGGFKVAANAVAGNPHLSEEEVQKKSVSELFSEDVYAPDYSAESFKQAHEQTKQTWSATADQIRDKKGVSDVITAARSASEGGDR
ncbi:hypothetical protein [Streptomyces sp. SAJ15]|uniref:hypothetical protein n=1 Tax=Streptomyces sp. SAJ15 TaxID=2011095 RepID=UPI001186D937|nr:hypothetical protein [Streptomyces sp. SAJ15]TVL89137.1 hypothetical protein CD790_28525 [Streptomyces sp. SAJ15]